MVRWSASSAHADMSATAACALGPHGGVALGSGVFGHPPLESGAAIAVAFWTREKSVSAPPAVATAADICARWGPNSPLPSGVPSIARSSAVMDAASGGVIANPSACAFARSIAAPMIRTRGARTSPGVSAGAASKSRATLQPSGPSFTALRCASAAASVAGSPWYIDLPCVSGRRRLERRRSGRRRSGWGGCRDGGSAIRTGHEHSRPENRSALAGGRAAHRPCHPSWCVVPPGEASHAVCGLPGMALRAVTRHERCVRLAYNRPPQSRRQPSPIASP